MATYTVPSGDRIWAGRDVVLPDPDDVSFTWPPGPNCVIPDAEGVNAPIHPKVLDFGTGGWNGYRYWMAYTPYPAPNNDVLENPCIVASNDGNTWVAHSVNPVVPAPVGATHLIKYNSDTHLAYKDGVMYLFWRPFDNTTSQWIERLMCKTSTDGTVWSDEVEILSLGAPGRTKSFFLSPSVEYFYGAWWCWSYRRDATPIVCELRKATTLGGLAASTPVLCTLLLADSAREPWHLDVTRVPNGWAMLISDRVRNGAQGRLWLALSPDGETWTVRPTALHTSSPNVYRSCLVKKADNSGFDCWVTDWDARKIRRLALTLGV